MIRAAILALAAGPVGAFTLEGEVSVGAGRFVKLDPAGTLVVGDDTVQDPNLYAFDEDQNILLERAIRVDVGPADGIIPAGTVVASHYVFFDPAFAETQIGSVAFDSAILGVATETGTLAATDFLANTEVVYLNPALRGLEDRDRVWIDPDDPFRLQVSWRASSPGDYVRVFTSRSPGM